MTPSAIRRILKALRPVTHADIMAAVREAEARGDHAAVQAFAEGLLTRPCKATPAATRAWAAKRVAGT